MIHNLTESSLQHPRNIHKELEPDSIGYDETERAEEGKEDIMWGGRRCKVISCNKDTIHPTTVPDRKSKERAKTENGLN